MKKKKGKKRTKKRKKGKKTKLGERAFPSRYLFIARQNVQNKEIDSRQLNENGSNPDFLKDTWCQFCAGKEKS